MRGQIGYVQNTHTRLYNKKSVKKDRIERLKPPKDIIIYEDINWVWGNYFSHYPNIHRHNVNECDLCHKVKGPVHTCPKCKVFKYCSTECHWVDYYFEGKQSWSHNCYKIQSC